MTYKELIAEAEELFGKLSKDGVYTAKFEAEKLIASKIDLCEDRNEHLDVLEWDVYKYGYAPMTRKEYEYQKNLIKTSYRRRLEQLEKNWNELGKNSPDYHKI